MLINYKNKRKHDNVKILQEKFSINMMQLMIKCGFFPLKMNGFFSYLKLEGGGNVIYM